MYEFVRFEPQFSSHPKASTSFDPKAALLQFGARLFSEVKTMGKPIHKGIDRSAVHSAQSRRNLLWEPTMLSPLISATRGGASASDEGAMAPKILKKFSAVLVIFHIRTHHIQICPLQMYCCSFSFPLKSNVSNLTHAQLLSAKLSILRLCTCLEYLHIGAFM